MQRRAGGLLVLVSCALLLAQFTMGSDSGTTHAAGTPARHVAHSGGALGGATAALAESRQARLDRAVTDVLSHSAFVTRGGAKRREIALTFDDGPGPYTPRVLIALNRLKVKATFFVVGQQERTFHTATMAQVERGHVVGDHTENHPRLGRLSALEQYDELVTPMQWLSKYGLPRPLLFRPPYGSYDQATLDQLKRLNMLMVMWSVDSQDYNRPGVAQIVDRVVSQVQPGGIVLLHDGGGDRAQTVKAIPIIVKRLRAKHFRLVTVLQLLRDDPPPAGRPLPRLATPEG